MEEMTQKIMDKGKAMIYRTRPVKFSKRKKFPIKPHASEIAFRTISLGRSVSILTRARSHIPQQSLTISDLRYRPRCHLCPQVVGHHWQESLAMG